MAGLGMFCGASLFQLVVMTVERLLAIFRPYSHNVCVTEGRIVAASIIAWVVNLLFTIIYLVFKVRFLLPVLAIFLAIPSDYNCWPVYTLQGSSETQNANARPAGCSQDGVQTKVWERKESLEIDNLCCFNDAVILLSHDCYSARSFQGLNIDWILHISFYWSEGLFQYKIRLPIQ